MNATTENETTKPSGSDAPTCSTVVFRIQDREGRGPWRPGFSQLWVEDRADHDNLQPWYVEMGPVHQLGIAGMHMGTACKNLEQLRRWFTRSEYKTLRRYGYQAVQMEVGRVLGESETQLVFERSKPLHQAIAAISLYPSNAEVRHGAKEADHD
jgi:hypothetical protein